MKKFIVVIIILLVCAVAAFKFLSKPSPLEEASEAELHGQHAVATAKYIQAVLDNTEAFIYPDKNKAVTPTESEWKLEVDKYLSRVAYSAPVINQKYDKGIQGILRCTSFVENENFITGKPPVFLSRDSLEKEWREAFVRERKSDAKGQVDLVTRAFKDTLSILCIRALNGYIYNSRLLDMKTGKRTDFILYPNSRIHLLVKPRDYLLICSSEVQFTEGLRGKTWRSPDNIISIHVPDKTSRRNITLKTRVHRSK